MACCAFANSTGLPITLLAVIRSNFPPNTEVGQVDPTLFLSKYLLVYPILQWGMGTWLLHLSSLTTGGITCSRDWRVTNESYRYDGLDPGILKEYGLSMGVSMAMEEGEVSGPNVVYTKLITRC